VCVAQTTCCLATRNCIVRTMYALTHVSLRALAHVWRHCIVRTMLALTHVSHVRSCLSFAFICCCLSLIADMHRWVCFFLLVSGCVSQVSVCCFPRLPGPGCVPLSLFVVPVCLLRYLLHRHRLHDSWLFDPCTGCAGDCALSFSTIVACAFEVPGGSQCEFIVCGCSMVMCHGIGLGLCA
jgi:hypothetical protein